MKRILLQTAFFCAAAVLGGCSDFFEVDTDDTLSNEDYISEESEIYTGYMGIITKMQAIGDKSIYLYEMRGEIMEPTANAPRELYSLYNYDDDLSDNSYADPAGYYEVINACNDYLGKLKAYKDAHAVEESKYKALVSSTLRVKAWTFITIAKLYGEVVWADKPIESLNDLSQFKHLNLEQTMAACKDLLNTGFDGVDGTYTTSWKKWLDPDGDESTSIFRYWDLMTPAYYALYGEICLWLGDYQECIDVIQTEMNNRYIQSANQTIAWLRSDPLLGQRGTIWDNANPYAYEACSAIMYDATHHQTNSLLKHFDSEYPNKYWIAPSEKGRQRFEDKSFGDFAPQNVDSRMGNTVRLYNNKWVFCKYRAVGSNVRKPYEDDVHIYTYRGAELYLMLAEAFNQLNQTEPMDALINCGIEAKLDNFEKDEDGTYSGTWYGFVPHWTSGSALYKHADGTSKIEARRYGDKGLRGKGHSTQMAPRIFTSDTKENDKEILKEWVLETCGEGKAYPALIRMSRRYNDNSFMADLISEKYEGKGNAEAIRAKIMNGDYFIHWDLNAEKKK